MSLQEFPNDGTAPASLETLPVIEASDPSPDFKRPADSIEAIAREALVAVWRYAEIHAKGMHVLRTLEWVGSRSVVDAYSARLSRVESVIKRRPEWRAHVPAIIALWKDREWARWHRTFEGELSGWIGLSPEACYQARCWVERMEADAHARQVEAASSRRAGAARRRARPAPIA